MYVAEEAFYIGAAVHTRRLQKESDRARLLASQPRRTQPRGSDGSAGERGESSGIGEETSPALAPAAAGASPVAGEQTCAVPAPALLLGPAADSATLPVREPTVPGPPPGAVAAAAFAEASGESTELGSAVAAAATAEPPLGPVVGGSEAVPQTLEDPAELALPAAGGPAATGTPAASGRLMEPEPEAAAAVASAAAAVKRVVAQRTPEQDADYKALMKELKERPWWPDNADTVIALATRGVGLGIPSDLGPREAAVEEFTAVAAAIAAAAAKGDGVVSAGEEVTSEGDQSETSSSHSEEESGDGESGDEESADEDSSDGEGSEIGSLDRALAERTLMVDLGIYTDSDRGESEDLLIWLLSNEEIQLPVIDAMLSWPNGEPRMDILEIACGGEHARAR